MLKIRPLLLCLLLAVVSIANAQSKKVSGQVTSASDGEPIPGVSIAVQGSENGTIADIDGKYSISVDENSILTFSFIGMESKEVSVAGQTELNVTLTSGSINMDEVMVVGYGTAKKSSFTGAATVVASEDIAKRQVSDVSKALEGISPGVQVSGGTGQPGSGSSIRIRGIGSINAGSAPLYIIDGMSYDGDINTIVPSDIESMTILKDAASTALYGARGGNGVILITTKKGKSGKTEVSFRAKTGINSRGVQEYDIMTSESNYYETYWDGLRNDRLYNQTDANDAAYTAAQAGEYASQNLITNLGYNAYNVDDNAVIDPTTGKLNSNASLLYHDNWADEMFRNGVRQEYGADIKGGTEKTNIFLSLNYLNDKGYIENSDFSRYGGRLNVNHEATKWMDVRASMGYTNTTTNAPSPDETAGVNMFYVSRTMAPIYPVYARDAAGEKVYDANNNPVYDFGDGANGVNRIRPHLGLSNPIATQILDQEETNADLIDAKVGTDITFLKDFKLTLNLGMTNQQASYLHYYNGEYGQFSSQNGIAYHYRMQNRGITTQQLLNWSKDFGDHSLTVLAGHETYSSVYNQLSASKENFLSPTNYDLDGAVKNPSSGGYTREYAIEGYLSNVQYDFRDKYYASVSYRRDASSVFHPDNRWGNFWSVGSSWRLDQEDFLSNASFIESLKLKASYGVQGNDYLNDQQGYRNYVPYQNQYTVSNNNDDIALNLSYTGNKNITWETSENFNLGTEFSLWAGRLSGEINYFSKKTSDLLFYRPQATSSGVNSYPDNIGDMKNSGYEFILSGSIIDNDDFKWNMSINGTQYKNEITALPPEDTENGIVSGTKKLTIGHSIYDYYIREYAGVDKATGRSLWYTDEEQADGTIQKNTTDIYDNATKYMVGKSSLPKFYGGLSTSINYKGLELSILGSFQLGGYTYDNVYRTLMHGGTSDGSNFHKDMLNRWTPNNMNSDIPLVDNGDPNINSRSDRWLISSNYFNISNITLGYTFPKAMLKKIDFKGLRLYAVCDNVALFSKRQGLDPRQNWGGINEFSYSPLRTMSLGIDVKF